MNVKIREKIKGKEMKVFVYASAFLLYVAAFLLATPTEIIQGMKTIIWSKDALDFRARLAGSGEPGETSQLLLIGMMIDKAEIEISDTRVELKLYKKFKEGF